MAFPDSSLPLIVISTTEPEVTSWIGRCYSIEESRARLGGIPRNNLYAMVRAGSLPERRHLLPPLRIGGELQR